MALPPESAHAQALRIAAKLFAALQDDLLASQQEVTEAAETIARLEARIAQMQGDGAKAHVVIEDGEVKDERTE